MLKIMRKIFILLLIIFPINFAAAEKQTTFNNDVFNKAQSDGKTVVVSSWIKYCTSCATQMKALKDVERTHMDRTIKIVQAKPLAEK